MAKVIVTKSKLIELLDTGMSRKQISEALGLPVNQVNLLIKTAGLKGRRAKKISFEFVDDSTPNYQYIDVSMLPSSITELRVPNYTGDMESFRNSLRSQIPNHASVSQEAMDQIERLESAVSRIYENPVRNVEEDVEEDVEEMPEPNESISVRPVVEEFIGELMENRTSEPSTTSDIEEGPLF